MSDLNYTFNVFEKIPDEEKKNWRLYVDAIYKSNPNKKNYSGEVISKLTGVGISGGIRSLGHNEPLLVVLWSTGEDIYWKDELDSDNGIYIYYGDNKTPGTPLHETNNGGNEVLKKVFEYASSDDIIIRKKIPPIFLFKKYSGRDVKFLGLAVPGIKGKPMKDWLVAVWGCNKHGERFQNYKALFTILDTSSGCEYENEFGINLAWINDIKENKTFESIYAPKEWKKYIENKNYVPLFAKKETKSKNKDEQLPNTTEKKEMLKIIHDYFIEKDHGYSFELFAAKMTKFIDQSVEDVIVTRPFKDGGIDAIGKYKIFSNVENIVYVDFYLQAKCYSESHSVGVGDTSRLISRIKNRQFGIMFTTSYISEQAYKELLCDGHPIVLITGKNIIDYLYDSLEIRNLVKLKEWLKSEYER